MGTEKATQATQATQTEQAAWDEAAAQGDCTLELLHGDRVELPLAGEVWREYEWLCPETGAKRVYRIMSPMTVYFREKGTTHTVVGITGIAHCVPMPGRYGCVLRWYNGMENHPARF